MANARTVQGSVSGRVQGVAYRYSMKLEADRLGVTGWVRNTADGRVEFLATGTPEAVQALLDWSQTGPPLADVVDVDFEEAEEAASETSFEITI